MNPTRGIFCVFTAAIVLLLFAALSQWSPTHLSFPSFEDVATKHGTDKVTTHKYQSLYDKYLRKYQGKPIKLLEIGLGCNMQYGPGASYYTWLEYLPNVDLYFIEYDAKCAEKYMDKTANAHVFAGNQEDQEFLTRFASETTQDGLFDVIIDDGGHSMNQQITSLDYLWKIVKPGGLYFIEDLQTSFWEQYGGDATNQDREKRTTIRYLQGLMDDMMAGWENNAITHDLFGIHCTAEICALEKRA